MSEREVARFQVRSESGEEHTVIENRTVIDVTSHDGRGEILGLRRYLTSTGLDVSYIDPNTFRIDGETCYRV